MGIFILIYSLSIIGAGCLARRYPTLISGYSTMSREKRRLVDIDGLSKMLRNMMVGSGVATFALYQLFYLLGRELMASLMLFVPLCIGCVIIAIKSRKFDHNPPEPYQKWIYIGATALFVLIIWSMIYGYLPTQTTITDREVLLSGRYGVTIPLDQIGSVQLTDHIPTIRIRTNGMSLGGVSKGMFRLDDFGKCRLFLRNYRGPFMIITERSGLRTIINNADTADTRRDYLQLCKSIDDENR